MTTKIKSTSLEDNAITTAKIASDAVTAAKIPANAIGSSELDLGASYAFTGTVTGAGSNAVSRISTGSAGSGVSSIEIDIPTDASYNHFVLNIHDLYGSGDGDLRMEIRKQSGSAYQTNYTYSTMERTYGASPSGASGNTGAGTLEMTYYNLGNAIAEANSYNIIITNNKSSTYHTKVYGTAYGLASGGNATVRAFGGSSNTIQIDDRIKILPSTGTLTHGEYALYGYTRS